MKHYPRITASSSALRGRSDSRTGLFLVEMLVALGVLTVGFLGIVSLLVHSLSLSRVVTDNYTASYLATEGVEVVKNLMDANIIQGYSWNCGIIDGSYEVEYNNRTPLGGRCPGTALEFYQGRFLAFNPLTKIYSYDTSQGVVATTFTRRVNIASFKRDPASPNVVNEIRVNSVIDWVTRGGGKFETNLEDHFFNYR